MRARRPLAGSALIALLALAAPISAQESPAGQVLPIPAVAPTDRDRTATDMIDDINRQRAGAGDPVLRVDPALMRLARQYAHVLIAWRRLAHVDPRGRGLASRLLLAHCRFRFAGENLAFTNTDERDAMLRLITSPPHLANLLNAQYTRVGVAAVAASVYGTMYVQEFAGD